MTDEKVRKMVEFLDKVNKIKDQMLELEIQMDRFKGMEDGKDVFVGKTGPLSVELPEHIAYYAIHQALEWYEREYDRIKSYFDKMEFEV